MFLLFRLTEIDIQTPFTLRLLGLFKYYSCETCLLVNWNWVDEITELLYVVNFIFLHIFGNNTVIEGEICCWGVSLTRVIYAVISMIPFAAKYSFFTSFFVYPSVKQM